MAVLTHSERCYAYLKHQLLEGGLDPGDPLSAESLSRALEVSRSPVMEALKRLAAEGFLQIIPQVGSRVITPDPREVGDFYRVFAASEAVIAGFAASRRSAAEAREYKGCVEVVAREAERAGGFQARDPQYRELNRRRFNALHALAHSATASEHAATMWDRSDFYSRIAFGSLYFSSFVKTSHKQIDRAVIRGDKDAAEKAVLAFLTRAGELIGEELQRQAEQRESHRARWRAKSL